mmetsp:Transcript_24439/g.45502  ORF Transcript_24439/g.45502 Transcript_24439/m.45502 type:complete len:372 (+) Transcript_24439:1166-2281(+)
MLQHFGAEHFADFLDQWDRVVAAVVHLQIGDGRIDLKRAQGRVVPAIFEDAAGAACPVVIVRAEDDMRARMGGGKRLEPRHGLRGDHQGDDRIIGLDIGGHALEIGLGDPRLEHGGQLAEDPVAACQIRGVGQGGREILECHKEVDPIVSGGQRHLDLGDDPVGAIGVADPVQVLAGDLDDARLRLHRDHAQADDIAHIAQAAPMDRAHAARPARDEPADGGRGPGRGKHPQFLPGMGNTGRVDILEQGTGFGNEPPRLDVLDRVHLVQVQNAAPRKGNGLPVIASACTARRDRHVMGIADAQGLDHFGLGPGGDHEISDQPVEPILEHGRIPEEIAALGFDRSRVRIDVQMGKGCQRSSDIGSGHEVLIR